MKKTGLAVSLIIACTELFSQISPPGLDDTNTAVWGAIGFSQNIGNRWTVTFYSGAALDSKPNNVIPFQRPAIFVINQESLYKFNSHWQMAFCTSFRNQNEYSSEQPYSPDDPALRTEIRYYLRTYYRDSFLKKGTIYYSFRPEYRTFFNHWDPWNPVSVELRFRYKVQAAYPLNDSKSNQVVIGNEVLTTTDHIKEPGNSSHWTKYKVTEDRLTTYFKHTFKKPDLVMNIGLMHQVKANGTYIAHLAFDFVLQNPFSKKI